MPRWDLQKFRRVSRELGSEMKSVGEVMAIGRSFEEVLQKALRELQIGAYGFSHAGFTFTDLEEEIRRPTPHRIFALARALRDGWTVERLHELSNIDPWFLNKCKNIVDFEQKSMKVHGKDLTRDYLSTAKQLGFSDAQLAWRAGVHELDVRKQRIGFGILPSVKKIDTFAGEFPARTNYLYLTYHGTTSDEVVPSGKPCAIVLGSGAYCIGSSVEFDLCCMSAIDTLQSEGYETVMINYNPETVSTDYDRCDQLYFEELSVERVLDIVDITKPAGVVVSTGGQIPNNLVKKLALSHVPIFGTAPKSIDIAESRDKFSALLDQLGIDQPAWAECTDERTALTFADTVGYPVLVRPSYVLSGSAMRVAFTCDQLKNYLKKATIVSTEAPVVITKFEENAKELDFDGVAAEGDMLIYAVSEHIENAGVHSGDATLVFPPQKTYLETVKRIRRIAKQLAESLHITGPFNIQFLAKDNRIKVIELNLRASRSFPFVSKVSGHDFIQIAIRGMLGKTESRDYRRKHYQTLDLEHVAVKAAQFSFSRLKGADPTLGVEMSSTGEVGCFGHDLSDAFLKAQIATGFRIPSHGVLLSAGPLPSKVGFLSAARKLSTLGLPLYATPDTHAFLQGEGVATTRVDKPHEGKHAKVLDLLEQKKIDLVINIPTSYQAEELTAGYRIRRKAIDMNIPLITNLQVARLMVDALVEWQGRELPIESWGDFV